MSIEVTKVSKRYGTQVALNEVSFSLKKGEIVGFLGPNGAGKSTMMKILAGFLKSFEGNISVNEIDITNEPIRAQKYIGYLPEHNPLYLDLYVREYLAFQARIYKVPQKKIAHVVEQVGLNPEAHKKIGQLSKGYQQRVGLAAAIIHDPDVLILDEPTTGLDPNQLMEIRALLKKLGKKKTILFSTHIMQEVEAICDRVIIIKKGTILMDNVISDLKESNQQAIEVTFDYKVEKQLIQKLPNLISCENDFNTTWQLSFESGEDMRPVIFDFTRKNGLKILELSSKNQNLENIFTELTA
ncbi:MAG: gliding motility-associated ABC transporter ATP-binding subunit GldA [Flavobacteriaceae bacterium]|nr:MAG: gliding motility-associated ABC transporter ATP-binding subunit GldA [Flavobacteriaceae bacterium]